MEIIIIIKKIGVIAIKVINFFLNYYFIKKYYSGSIPLETILEYNKWRIFGHSKLLCHAPISSLYFKTDGNVVACCKNNIDVYGNIKKQPLKEIWNSLVRKELFKKIKSNNLDVACETCKLQLISKNYQSVHARILDMPFFIKKKHPVDITFEVSNKCNLACIMCDGYKSSYIRKYRENLSELPNVYPDNFLHQLEPFIKHFRIIRLQGGEPFLINFYLELIERIITINKGCIIYIQSNGTILTDRIRKLINNKQIRLSISIDSFDPELYEKIRKNANFKQTIKNIIEFNIISKLNNKILNINYCIMNNNILQLDLFFDFIKIQNLTFEFIIIEDPIFLSIYNIDENKKTEFINYLHNLLNKYEQFNTTINQLINTIENTNLNNLCIQKNTKHSVEELFEIYYNLLKDLIDINSDDFDLIKYKINIEDRKNSNLLINLINQCYRYKFVNGNNKHYNKEEIKQLIISNIKFQLDSIPKSV